MTTQSKPQAKMICPYCNAQFTPNMDLDFDFSMGSEWTGMYGENVEVEIRCEKCKKLIYKKNYDV